MQYHFIASQADGKLAEGDIDAKDIAEVLQFLTAHALRPVSVKPIQKNRLELRIFKGRINLTDQIFLSKYLALMLKIGTGLLQAINILIEDFAKPAMKSLLLEIRSNLEKGQPFYATFAKYPRIFSQVYVNLIKAGEASGDLEAVFENLTTSLSKEKALRDQTRGALIYPILLLAMSILILIFLVTFALPKIAKVFLESGFQPPTFSRVVFSVGLFFGQIGFYLLGLFILALIGFLFACSGSFNTF